MVSNLLTSAGVPMGDEDSDGSNVGEDIEISKLIQHKSFTPKLKSLIEARNEENPMWGWKKPGSYRRMQWIEEGLRNPHFIFTYRDLTAISKRRIMARKCSFEEVRDEIIEQMYLLNKYLQELKYPTYAFSYEWAMRKKENFIGSIFDFLQLDSSEEAVKKAVNSMEQGKATYVERFARKRLKGATSSENSGVIRRGKAPNSGLKDIFITGLHRVEIKGLKLLFKAAEVKIFDFDDGEANIDSNRIAFFPKYGKDFNQSFRQARNPHVLHFNSDFLSVASRKKISKNLNLKEALDEEFKWLKKFDQVKCPSMMISHEKLVFSKLKMVKEIADFLELPLDFQQFVLTSAEGEFNELMSIDGAVNRRDGDKLLGWVKTFDDKVTSVDLVLCEGSTLVEEFHLDAEVDAKGRIPFNIEPNWSKYKESLELKTSEGMRLRNGLVSL